MKRKAILLHASDNVATALADLKVGEGVAVERESQVLAVTLGDDIPFGHKFALSDIAQGEEVRKFGLPIGKALAEIRAGQWVHVHNCRSDRWGYYNDRFGTRA